jgi:hypothetical protein
MNALEWAFYMLPRPVYDYWPWPGVRLLNDKGVTHGLGQRAQSR